MKIKCSLLQFPSIPGSQIAFFLQLHFWSCISGCLFLCWSLCGNPTWSNHLSSWNPTFCSVKPLPWKKSHPRCSMYGIFTYIWAIFGVNVGKYSIHGAYGHWSNHNFWSNHVWLFVLVKSQHHESLQIGRHFSNFCWSNPLFFTVGQITTFSRGECIGIGSLWFVWFKSVFFATFWYILLLKSR